MKKNVPSMAKKTSPMVVTDAENTGLRNSATSRAGWSERRSYQTNSASTARPPSVDPQTSGSVTVARSPPSMMP